MEIRIEKKGQRSRLEALPERAFLRRPPLFLFAEIRRFRAELSAGPLTTVNWFQTAVGSASCPVPP